MKLLVFNTQCYFALICQTFNLNMILIFFVRPYQPNGEGCRSYWVVIIVPLKALPRCGWAKPKGEFRI